MSGSNKDQVELEIEEERNIELLELVNVLLAASYEFLMLNLVSKYLNMPATNWYARRTDEKCRDAALMILSWLEVNGEYIQLADISKPTYDEPDLTEEFVIRRWEEVENSIYSYIEKINTKLEENYCKNKGEIIDMLNLVSACLTDLIGYDDRC